MRMGSPPLPGRTSLIQHQVETHPGMMVRSRPYRLPEHKRKVVQAELKAMVEMGVIEECNSAWCSPIVLVGKKDGSIRFCVDYHKVNEVSRFDAYPMPHGLTNSWIVWAQLVFLRCWI